MIPERGFATYALVLRETPDYARDRTVELRGLPLNLTAEEAKRMGDFLASLVIPETPEAKP